MITGNNDLENFYSICLTGWVKVLIFERRMLIKKRNAMEEIL